MAQQGVEQVGLKNHDLARSARMALYGGGMYPLVLDYRSNAD